MMGTSEFEPSADTVMQDEHPALKSVPVTVEAPVTVHELPARGGGYRALELDTTAERILTADPRRKSAIILPVDGDIYIGDDQAQATGDGRPRWTSGVPLPITHRDEVWASATTGTVEVTIVIEQWAS